MLALLSVVLCRPISAQENVRFKRLSIEDGLSQSTVEAIVQDHQGFMWFGTEDGLNRYDGYTFRKFKHDPDDPGSLADNNVWCLHVDRNGFLWVGTYSEGLDRFDPATESFEHFVHDPSDPQSLSENQVRSIAEDRHGDLWIGTLHGGLNRLEAGSQRFSVLRHDPENENSLPSDNVRCAYPDSQDFVWIATNSGLGRYDMNRGGFTNFQTGADGTNSLRSNNVRHVMGDRSGILWISTRGALTRYDPRIDRFTNYHHDPEDSTSIGSDNLRKAYEDRQGRLWIVSNFGGLTYFDRQKGTFQRYVHDPTDRRSLSNNSTRVAFQDRGGILWIGTIGGGINAYDPKTDRFTHYGYDPDESNSLSHSVLWAIAEGPAGGLWFGTARGLDRFDRETGEFEGFSYNRKSPDDPEQNDYTRTLYWDRAGLLWIGSTYAGVVVYDQGDGQFTTPPPWKDGSTLPKHGEIRSIYEDSHGDMWVCTTKGGVATYNPGTQVIREIRHDPDDPNSLSSNKVISLLEDSEGVYWVATASGLNRFAYDKGSSHPFTAVSTIPEITRYLHDPDDPQSISNSYVLSIHEASNGDLYFATMLGLTRLRSADRGAPVFTRYFMKNGLPSDVVYGMLEDSRGYLWLSTNFGLSRFDPVNETFRNYDKRDGLLGNEYNTGAYARTTAGTFVFGGVGGASEFHPDSMVDNPYQAPVVLTGFNVFEKPVRLARSLNSLEEITLSYRDNYFSFEFASLDFSTPDRNRYAYKLEGQDRDWTQAGTRNFAAFTHVDPGTYTFMVKGTNGDGVWNQECASIRIIITPPFWKTWWFILILVAAIAGGITFLIMVRVRQLLAIERLRSKIAADLHDDIGAGLTEISIMGDIISQKLPAEPRTLVQSETERIGATARGLISSMSDIVWLVDPRHDSLYDLVSRLSDSFKETLDVRNIEFRTKNLESLKSIRLRMECRQHLLLIFKEAINNSLKYSGCTEMSLGVVVDGRSLSVKLTDNGTGFDVKDHPVGNGLENMSERARLLGGRLTVLSSISGGTTVEYVGSIAKTSALK